MSKKKSSKAGSGVASGQQGPEQGSSTGEGKPTGEAQPQDAGQTPDPSKKLTLSDVLRELETLKQTVQHHTQQLAEFETRLTRPRKSISPTSRTRVQIRDKETGVIYPSQNNAYRTLLKNGDLKELVDKGIFGSEPLKNSYGWFALKRAWPDRFEVLRETKTEDTAGTPRTDKDCEDGDLLLQPVEEEYVRS